MPPRARCVPARCSRVTRWNSHFSRLPAKCMGAERPDHRAPRPAAQHQRRSLRPRPASDCLPTHPDRIRFPSCQREQILTQQTVKFQRRCALLFRLESTLDCCSVFQASGPMGSKNSMDTYSVGSKRRSKRESFFSSALCGQRSKPICLRCFFCLICRRRTLASELKTFEKL